MNSYAYVYLKDIVHARAQDNVYAKRDGDYVRILGVCLSCEHQCGLVLFLIGALVHAKQCFMLNVFCR